MSSASRKADWQEMFNELKKHHDEAYRIVANAIRLEESGRKNEAVSEYEAGLVLIDKALNLTLECSNAGDPSWEKACSMVQKMRKTKKEVLCRLADSQALPEPDLPPPSQPPSYEEAMSTDSSTDSSSIQTYRELGIALQNLKVETGAQSALIVYTHPKVQIYFISPDGTVTATLQPDELRIVELEDGGEGNRPRAYLQVGHWIYPLVPGVSPCFRAEVNTFILPDVHSGLQGAAVGIVLPKEEDESLAELLNDILCGILQEAPTPYTAPSAPAGRVRRDLGRSISQGAHYISQGLIRGAERAGQFMNDGTPRLMHRITPEATPASVNPKVQTGLRVAKNITGTAVTVTGYVASGIGQATAALGRYLAPHIQKQGTRLLSSTCNYSEEEASKKVGGVLQVAAGAVEGFGTVYQGLEHSAKILGTSLASNTVKLVEHKYGYAAGEVTGETLSTAGNMFVAANNIRHLTPKSLAKTTAKETGKAVVRDYALNGKNGFNDGASGSKS